MVSDSMDGGRCRTSQQRRACRATSRAGLYLKSQTRPKRVGGRARAVCIGPCDWVEGPQGVPRNTWPPEPSERPGDRTGRQADSSSADSVTREACSPAGSVACAGGSSTTDRLPHRRFLNAPHPCGWPTPEHCPDPAITTLPSLRNDGIMSTVHQQNGCLASFP
jgi:hypothetical protein